MITFDSTSVHKPLLVFAHRGEASAFLTDPSLQPIDFLFANVFESPRELLLISGEGIHITTAKVAALCAAFHESISHIVNLGIAGRLHSSLEIGRIYSVHTAFAEEEEASFRSADENARFHCVSARKRVLDKSDASRLQNVAHMADREVWACGFISRLFNLPFYSFKLISDAPAEGVATQRIKQNAAGYSKLLHDFYRQQFPH